MSGSYPNMLADGVNLVNTFAPFELWAGESDLVTSQGTAGTNLAQFTVVAYSATNTIVAWAPAATDASNVAIGFMAQAAVSGGPAVFYTGGVPNHAVLIWPAGVTTLDARKAAFKGSNITISALL